MASGSVTVIALGLLCSFAAAPAGATQCDSWPAWQQFKQLYLSTDGRVVDASTQRHVTVSEGQSYALTFALIANDPDTFGKVLQWTQNNLAAGDLSRNLPAWQWGRADDGTWRVLDQNSAADADLWISYALIEAGRLWHNPSYTMLGRALSDQILRDEVALIPGLGPTLLPGPKGFVEHQTWRLNASYVPIQLLRAIGQRSQNKLWHQVLETSQRLIIASAPHGAAADWTDYRAPDGFIADTRTQGLGSYDAIRVYLWAGMLSDADPLYRSLSSQFAPMLRLVAQRPVPPEIIEPDTLNARGEGAVGFSAALMPLLSRTRADEALRSARARVESAALQNDQHYYSDALSLFGLGFVQGRYRFDRGGELLPQWNTPCLAR